MASKDKIHRRNVGLALIALAGICSFVLLLWITVQGVGVSPDSTVYIGAARSFLTGSGLIDKGAPLTRFPPGYPILLALSGLLRHADVVQGARLLGALLFAANTILFGLAVRKATDGSLPIICGVLLFFLSSEPIITIHAMAWSEPLFIAEVLACFLALSSYFLKPRLRGLLLFSILAGAAISTRYVGVTLLPPMVFGLLLFGNRSLKDRVRDVLTASTIALLPLCVWLTRNLLTADTTTGRQFAIHRFGADHIRELLRTMFQFALPVSVSIAMQVMLLAAIAVVVLLTLRLRFRTGDLRRNASSISITLPSLCLFFFATYIVFLLFSISFFDAATPLDFRILLPGLVPLTVAGLSLVWSLVRVLQQRLPAYCFVALLILSISVNAIRGFSNLAEVRKDGLGYASRAWKNSDIIAYLREASPDVTLYTNDRNSIDFYIGKVSAWLPRKEEPTSLRPNVDFEEQLRKMSAECREGKALVVYFDTVYWRPHLPRRDEIETKGNLPILRRLEDGVVYGTRD